MADTPVNDMSLDELQAEFKALADKMIPITARRKEIAAQMEKLSKNNQYKGRIKNLSPEEKAGLLKALQEDLGK
jgi:hypothetical protein